MIEAAGFESPPLCRTNLGLELGDLETVESPQVEVVKTRVGHTVECNKELQLRTERQFDPVGPSRYKMHSLYLSTLTMRASLPQEICPTRSTL